ncbi:MAG: hypothetical protein JSW25_04070 [Thermoplasmata archaeon]|nr:MAG: hypothetical protein JSW25_04070 [Thermoplasmata archaeon]
MPERWDDWSDKGFGYLDEEEEVPEGKLTPEQRTFIFRWFWLIALVMMLAGFGLMIMLLLGDNPFP